MLFLEALQFGRAPVVEGAVASAAAEAAETAEATETAEARAFAAPGAAERLAERPQRLSA